MPDYSKPTHWKRWIVALVITIYVIWSSGTSVGLEGRWWNERALRARNILNVMPQVAEQLPPGHVAYLFGLEPDDFGAMAEEAGLKAYGYSPSRFILVGLDRKILDQIKSIRKGSELNITRCFQYFHGRISNCTAEFRINPYPFIMRMIKGDPTEAFIRRLEVRLATNAKELEAGRDTLILHIIGLDAKAVDVLYALNDSQVDAVECWKLDDNGTAAVFVDRNTKKGTYRFIAIRNSSPRDRDEWIAVDTEVVVK